METLSDTSTLAKRPPAPKTIHRWFIAIPFLVAIVWSLIGLNITLSRCLKKLIMVLERKLEIRKHYL